jgi:hypothetical protein
MFRKMNKKIDIDQKNQSNQNANNSVLGWYNRACIGSRNHLSLGVVGLAVGIVALAIGHKNAKKMLIEFDGTH